jgi:hypothetical protein
VNEFKPLPHEGQREEARQRGIVDRAKERASGQARDAAFGRVWQTLPDT